MFKKIQRNSLKALLRYGVHENGKDVQTDNLKTKPPALSDTSTKVQKNIV